jgi:hypothetical protein
VNRFLLTAILIVLCSRICRSDQIMTLGEAAVSCGTWTASTKQSYTEMDCHGRLGDGLSDRRKYSFDTSG